MRLQPLIDLTDLGAESIDLQGYNQTPHVVKIGERESIGLEPSENGTAAIGAHLPGSSIVVRSPVCWRAVWSGAGGMPDYSPAGLPR